MKSKRVLILILFLFILSFTLVACDNSKTADNGTNSDIPATDEEPSEPDEPSETTEKYTKTELTLSRDDLKIYGVIYVPTDKKEKMPTVILSHSAQLTHKSMDSYCVEFASRGYVAYAFDFCGGSANSKSSGKVDEMTVFTEVEDLKAVIDQILSLDYVDGNNLYLFGSSQGGLVSSITASDEPELIKGLILLYPAFNIPDEVKRFENSGFSGLGAIAYGQAFMDTIKDYDVYSKIASYTGRVLILHGARDSMVNISYSEKALKFFQNAELVVVKGANHGFNKQNYSFFGNYDSIVWKSIDEFLS